MLLLTSGSLAVTLRWGMRGGGPKAGPGVADRDAPARYLFGSTRIDEIDEDRRRFRRLGVLPGVPLGPGDRRIHDVHFAFCRLTPGSEARLVMDA